MDKPRRHLDPLDLQEQYEADRKAGYAAFLDGEPAPQRDSTGRLEGWEAGQGRRASYAAVN